LGFWLGKASIPHSAPMDSGFGEYWVSLVDGD